MLLHISGSLIKHDGKVVKLCHSNMSHITVEFDGFFWTTEQFKKGLIAAEVPTVMIDTMCLLFNAHTVCWFWIILLW